MSDPPQSDGPRLTHEWLYPNAPGQRQCRYCLVSESNVSQMQEVGLCPARMQQQHQGDDACRQIWWPEELPVPQFIGRIGERQVAGDYGAVAPEIGAAYVAGMVARRNWLPNGHHGDPNPYHHATQAWLAWRSGWNDQGLWMARGPVREQDG